MRRQRADGGSGDGEGGEMSAKRGRRDEDPGGDGEELPPHPMTFRFLAPQTLANAVEAFKGRIEEAGSTVTMSDYGDYYPNTQSRTVTLESTTDGAVQEAMRRILSMVGECRECAHGHQGEFRVTCPLPSKSVSALIGVRGANVQALQQATGCFVHVHGEALGFGPGGDRVVHINGTPQALDSAFERVIGCVQEFRDQPWFPKWASRTNAERAEAMPAPPLRQSEEEQVTRPSPSGRTRDQDGMPRLEGMANMMSSMGGMNPMMGGMTAMMGGMNPMMGCMGGMNQMMGGMGGMNPMMGGMGMMGCGMDGMGGMGGMPGMGGMGMMGGGPASIEDIAPGSSSDGGGRATGGKDNFTLGKELVTQVMDDMPSYVTQDPRGFVLRSAVPSRMVPALQRLGVQAMATTGTKICFHGEANGAARVMSVEGPLFNVCAAYMTMMRRYLEVERGVTM